MEMVNNNPSLASDTSNAPSRPWCVRWRSVLAALLCLAAVIAAVEVVVVLKIKQGAAEDAKHDFDKQFAVGGTASGSVAPTPPAPHQMCPGPRVAWGYARTPHFACVLCTWW